MYCIVYLEREEALSIIRDTENPRITPTERVTHICRGKTKHRKNIFYLGRKRCKSSLYIMQNLIHNLKYVLS